jgi:hypothetical protein
MNGGRGIAPHNLNFGIKWRIVVSFMTQLLYPGKKVHVGQKAGWIPELLWTWWQREKFLPLLGTESQSSSPQPIHYTV